MVVGQRVSILNSSQGVTPSSCFGRPKDAPFIQQKNDIILLVSVRHLAAIGTVCCACIVAGKHVFDLNKDTCTVPLPVYHQMYTQEGSFCLPAGVNDSNL